MNDDGTPTKALTTAWECHAAFTNPVEKLNTSLLDQSTVHTPTNEFIYSFYPKRAQEIGCDEGGRITNFCLVSSTVSVHHSYILRIS